MTSKALDNVAKLNSLWVSVKEYGAKGDGVTNDRVAIQAAIDSGAGTVFFPKGVYMVRQTSGSPSGPYGSPVIQTASNQTLCGEGDASEIKLGAHSVISNYTIRTTDTDNVKIMNLKINANKAEQTGILPFPDEFSHCIAVWNSNNVTIENCTLVNSIGDGILVAAGPFAGSPPTGEISENVQIIGNRFDLNTRQGISIVRGRNIRIIGNDIAGTTGQLPGAGIDIEADFTSDIVDSITITGNTIRNNFWGIITIAPNGPAQNVTIASNTFIGNRAADIRLKAKNVVIADNVIKITGPKTVGAYAAIDLDTCEQVSITGNTIESVYDGENGGIRCLARCVGISIIGNTIKATKGPGIALDPVTEQAFFGFGGVQSVTIAGNTLYDCLIDTSTSGAILLRGTTTGGDNRVRDVVIENNVIYDSRSGGAWSGVQLQIAGTSTAETFTMLNNSIVGPTIGTRQLDIIDGSLEPDNQTSFHFPGQVVSRRRTLNFDLTSVTFQDLTMDCTGANLGDCVIVGVPNAAIADEVLYWGWVSAADTVTVRAMRVGATARNPASGLFYITVVKMLARV